MLVNDVIHVLVTLPFPDELIAKLREVSPRLEVRVVKARKVEEVPDEEWDRVDVLYTNRVLPSLEQAPHLRWIQFHWAGVDHAIDAPIMKRAGLTATSLSGAAATQVAEYVLMMLLGLGHHFPDLLHSQRRGEWPKDRWERFSPRELRDCTIGIVGYGSIGRQVARLALPFGAHIYATKRDLRHLEDYGYVLDGFGDPHGDFVHRFYPPQALRSMVKECDYLVITAPLTPATNNLINGEILAAMKPGAFLVDVSRGGIVEQNALYSVLRDHKIAGAALDVFPEEPLPADSPLWKASNVIITPHISGDTPHYDVRAIEMFAHNLRRYLEGQPLLNQIDVENGY